MAYDFSNGKRLTCDNVSPLNVGNGDFTFSCVVLSRNVKGVGTAPLQLGFVQTSTTSGGLSTNYATGFLACFGIGNGVGFNGGLAFNVANAWIGPNVAAISINTIYRIACVRLDGVVTVYIDGAVHASATAAGSITGTNLCLGGYYDSTYCLDGQLSECAIWNAALTGTEIASLAAGFTPDQIRPQSLQFYAPLVRDLVDVRGGRTITNVNSATVADHPRIIT